MVIPHARIRQRRLDVPVISTSRLHERGRHIENEVSGMVVLVDCEDFSISFAHEDVDDYFIEAR